MAAEYSANALQTVGVNQPVIFTESPVPCNKGLIFHRDESGTFLLANNAQNCNNCGCGCRRIYETRYEVAFHANIAIPTGGTVEEIQLAIAIDGVIDPSSVMRITPAAVEEFGNVGADIIVAVPSLCGCESVSVINSSTQPIEVQNANIVFDYAGVHRVF
jgi:hypothetical protein